MLHVGCKKSLELTYVWKNEMPLKQMCFRLNPSYIERDGQVCTRSASSFWRNPLNFCTHEWLWMFELNEVRNVWNFSMWLCMLHVECKQKSWVKKVWKNEMPLKQMSFRLKPSYFERYGPVCTRSASSFCRNPLNFSTHVMWVKWWFHAKFQPFLSSVVVLSDYKFI